MNADDIEYWAGPVMSGQISYNFPAHKPITGTFTILPQVQVTSERIYPIKIDDENDEFLFKGAL